MAKNSSGKTPTSSRIRFVMVEAELGNGDVGQITQAIQNALRSPAVSPVKRIAVTTTAATGAIPDAEIELDAEDVEQKEVGDAPSASPKARSPRKLPRTPDIISIDMNTDVSLASFTQGKDSNSQSKKYLIASAWLKEHRSIGAVSAGHIYTCFRSMGWTTNIPDFWQPLRDLKAKKYFGKNDQGEYEINHIGLDYVKKLGGPNGAG
jgi:hypothetical protein